MTEIGLVRRCAILVAGDDWNYPRMAGDEGTANRGLIACSCNHYHAVPGSLVERLLQNATRSCGGMREAKAQVDHSCATVDAERDRRGQLQSRCAWQLRASIHLSK